MITNQKGNWEDKCPICGSDNIEVTTEGRNVDTEPWRWHCKACDTTGGRGNKSDGVKIVKRNCKTVILDEDGNETGSQG